MTTSFDKLDREEIIKTIENIENNFDDIKINKLCEKLITLALKMDENFSFQEAFLQVSKDLIFAKEINDRSKIALGSHYLKTKCL